MPREQINFAVFRLYAMTYLNAVWYFRPGRILLILLKETFLWLFWEKKFG